MEPRERSAMRSRSPSRSRPIRNSKPFIAGAATILALGFAPAAAAAPALYRIEPELTYADRLRKNFRQSRRLRRGRDRDDQRSEFGMIYALGMVGDEIDLSFQVTAFCVPAVRDSDHR